MGLLDDLLDFIYPGKRYGTERVTRLGVHVRSKAEERIAHYFDSLGLHYQYEQELRAGVWIFTQKVSAPDFYLPDHDVYVEYWGLVNAPDAHTREKYVRSMKWKMAQYHSLGVKFISLYPDNLKNLDWHFRKKFKEATGKNLPNRRG